MANYNVDFIPTRQRIPDRQAEAIAKSMVDTLMAAWGLPNARKIFKEVNKKVREEGERRKR